MSREWLRPTAPGPRHRFERQPTHATRFARVVGRSASQRSPRGRTANHAGVRPSRREPRRRHPAESLILQHFDARLGDRASGVGRKRLAAIVAGPYAVSAVIRFTAWGLSRSSSGLVIGISRNRPRGSHAACGQPGQAGASGRRDPLIFERFRARLPARCRRWPRARPRGPLRKKLDSLGE